MTFLAYSQPKSPEVWKALAKGFDALNYPWFGVQRPLPKWEVTVILGGLGFDQPALLKAARDAGHPYVFVDSGYFATHENGKRVRYRVVPGAYAHHWLLPPHYTNTLRIGRERFAELGLKVEPWRKTGRHVLVCLSSPAHQEFFGLEAWLRDTIGALEQHTDRPIVVRGKSDPAPLESQIQDAWAVVAWSSNVAVTAALAGIPVFTGPESAALPVGLTDLARIEAPLYADNREDWAAGLAVGQFTVAEIANGMACMAADNWRPRYLERAA